MKPTGFNEIIIHGTDQGPRGLFVGGPRTWNRLLSVPIYWSWHCNLRWYKTIICCNNDIYIRLRAAELPSIFGLKAEQSFKAFLKVRNRTQRNKHANLPPARCQELVMATETLILIFGFRFKGPPFVSTLRLILINVPDRVTTDSPVMATETLDKLQRLRFIIHLTPFRYIELVLTIWHTVLQSDPCTHQPRAWKGMVPQAFLRRAQWSKKS
jgi:hypothetical protein